MVLRVVRISKSLEKFTMDLRQKAQFTSCRHLVSMLIRHQIQDYSLRLNYQSFQ